MRILENIGLRSGGGSPICAPHPEEPAKQASRRMRVLLSVFSRVELRFDISIKHFARSVCKTVSIESARSEHAIRIVSELLKRHCPQKPCEKWIFIAHPIGDRMNRHEAGTFSHVLAIISRMECSLSTAIWQLTGVEMVHAPFVLAPETLRPFSTSNLENRDCRAVSPSIQPYVLVPSEFFDRFRSQTHKGDSPLLGNLIQAP